METDFKSAKVGDRVWDVKFGFGKINEICDVFDYPIRVEFDTGYNNNYTFKGHSVIGLNRTLFWDEIKFDIPERPKRMVKKTVEAWANVYKHRIKLHNSRKKAEDYEVTGRIACVKLTGEYEVEE